MRAAGGATDVGTQGKPQTNADLTADALRESLGFDKWAMLGHSFGARPGRDVGQPEPVGQRAEHLEQLGLA